MVDVAAIRAFRDNYIWAFTSERPSADTPSARACALVDPGDAIPVVAYLKANNLRPAALLITHHHGDHTGGIELLLSKWSVPVFGPAAERIHGVSHPLHGGETIALPENLGKFSVIAVPGHTSGHIAYFGCNSLFCGDTLFGAGCGRLFEGTPSQMFESLNKLARLPTSTFVYCAHEYTLSNLNFAAAVEPGNGAIAARKRAAEVALQQGQPTLPSTIADELATNPFLRCGEGTVQHSAERHAGRELGSALDVFTVIRQWKDQW